MHTPSLIPFLDNRTLHQYVHVHHTPPSQLFSRCTPSLFLRHGVIPGLEWIRDNKKTFPFYACSYAAECGQLETLKWLRAQDPPCPWNERVCSQAAFEGHLKTLKWLRAQDPPCPWNEDVCMNAARGGHLEILKWARAQDPPCPWNERVCGIAAWIGHVEILQWLRAQDPPCPWNERECQSQAIGPEVLFIYFD